MPKYLRQVEAAEYIGVNVRTLIRWMKRRVIPYRRVGRIVLFDPAEIDMALRRFRVKSMGEPDDRRQG